MELGEFAIEFLQSSLIITEEDKISQEDSITTDILEYIIDSGEINLGVELCHYKVRGIKINAWNYDEEDDSFDLFVTIFKGELKLTKVSDKDILEAFNKCENFLWSAREGKLSEKIDESESNALDLVQMIEQTKSKVKNIKLFVLTNGKASATIVPDAKEDKNVYIEYQLWDIERVYQQELIRTGKQKIEIDFINEYNHRLNCLKMDNVSEKIDAYLAIVPGTILASIYGKYRQGLFEKNVRTFLTLKAKVNQGIRKTILGDADMFFSYNNGISTTAEKLVVEFDNNVPYITKIENLQIVNGAQTTASIFATSMEKECDLSRVFIQMKISVVKKITETDDIVGKISKYANTQTTIKNSDFSSNSNYHIKLQEFSRSEWSPSKTGGKATNKWFYERTRGQYLDEKSKDPKIFESHYPKKQKFTKTDLAKFEMSWWQRPYDVSLGGEKNFKKFVDELVEDKNEITKKYYYRLIAKAILFNAIDTLVSKRKLGGYKANMVTYILSWLSYKSNKKLNLDTIWENQAISEPLNNLIEQMIEVVWRHINTPTKTGMNITEWCKKQECWLKLKDVYIETGSIIEEIKSDNNNYIENDLIGQELSPHESKMIDEAKGINSDTWFSVAKWAKENNRFTPFDRKLSYNLGVLANRKVNLSAKQAKNALRILKQAKEEGFEE
jgi:hypothetical protein